MPQRLRVRRAPARRVALGFLLCLGACTVWVRRPDITDQAFEMGARVQLWMGGHDLEVRGVQIRRDSLFAVPAPDLATCQPCTRGYALRDIDSIRVRDLPRSNGHTVAFVAMLTLVAILAYGVVQLNSHGGFWAPPA
jgi:hypothetical protein